MVRCAEFAVALAAHRAHCLLLAGCGSAGAVLDDLISTALVLALAGMGFAVAITCPVAEVVAALALYDDLTAVAAFLGCRAVTVVGFCGVFLVYCYSQFGFISRLVGYDDGLLTICGFQSK